MFTRLSQLLGHLGRSSQEEAGPVPVLDPAEVQALEQELEAFACVRAPEAAKERTWVLIREEAARRLKVSQASPQVASGRGSSRSLRPRVQALRLGLATALTVAAIAVGALGLADLRQSRQVASTGGQESGGQVPQSAAQATSAATAPVSESTTVSQPVSTTVPQGQSTQQATNTNPTAPASTGSTTVATGSTIPAPSTTQPASTTTRTVMAREEREREALALVDFLAQAIVTGDRSRAQAAIADSAAFGLSQLLASLRSPVSHSVKLFNDTGSQVKVLLTFGDRVPTDSGTVLDVERRFLCVVSYGAEGAQITAIYAAP